MRGSAVSVGRLLGSYQMPGKNWHLGPDPYLMWRIFFTLKLNSSGTIGWNSTVEAYGDGTFKNAVVLAGSNTKCYTRTNECY